jgi:hypothetical protein
MKQNFKIYYIGLAANLSSKKLCMVHCQIPSPFFLKHFLNHFDKRNAKCILSSVAIIHPVICLCIYVIRKKTINLSYNIYLFFHFVIFREQFKNYCAGIRDWRWFINHVQYIFFYLHFHTYLFIKWISNYSSIFNSSTPGMGIMPLCPKLKKKELH